MEIRVHGRDVPKPLISFGHLPFDDRMKNLIIKKSFEKPTSIQCQVLKKEKLVLIYFKGITLYFEWERCNWYSKNWFRKNIGLCMAYDYSCFRSSISVYQLNNLFGQREIDKNEGPIGLILCPTRELAQQVYIETKNFAKVYNCK